MSEVIEYTEKQLEEALNKTKVSLMLQASPFLSSIALQLKYSFNEDINTADVCSTEMRFNPQFFMSMDKGERVGVMAHEVHHLAYMHAIRRGNRNPKLWNIAGDYVINYNLRHAGFSLPDFALYEAHYGGLSTEEVYDLIKDEHESQFPNSLGFDINYSAGSDGDEQVSSDSEEAVRIKEMVTKAITQARLTDTAGSIPGEVYRTVQDLINPKIDWKEHIMRFVDAYAQTDYSFKKPNKRYSHVIMPSLYSENLENITVVIDTSGSISEEILQEILTEVQSIKDTFNPKSLTVIDCDSMVHNIYEVDDDTEIMELEFSGYGGTAFTPALDVCQERDATLVLYFTDLYGENITDDDGYTFPLLWICYSKAEPPSYGEVIYYDR